MIWSVTGLTEHELDQIHDRDTDRGLMVLFPEARELVLFPLSLFQVKKDRLNQI